MGLSCRRRPNQAGAEQAVEADGRPQTAAHRLTARRWADSMRNLRSIGLGLLAFAHASDVEAKVGATPVSDLIRSADVIVLAKVVKVDRDHASDPTTSKGAVAIAEVMESWKGDPDKTVKFSLERTWDCDVSEAIVDERAVLILTREYKGPERVRARPGIQLLSFWGRGRMPIVEQDGKLFARIQGDVVIPKGDLEFFRSPAYHEDRLVELDKLRAYVKNFMAPAAAQQAVAADGGAAGKSPRIEKPTRRHRRR